MFPSYVIHVGSPRVYLIRWAQIRVEHVKVFVLGVTQRSRQDPAGQVAATGSGNRPRQAEPVSECREAHFSCRRESLSTRDALFGNRTEPYRLRFLDAHYTLG
jgi:hypothetical protein